MRAWFHCMLSATLLLAWSAPVVLAAPPITAAAIAPDGRHVLLGSQSGIEIRSWPQLEVTAQLPTALEHVHDLAFAPDGRLVLAAGGSPAEAGIVEAWSWPEPRKIRQVSAHQDVVYRVAWSADGKRWATAGGDTLCLVFDADSGERRARYEGHSRPVLAVCFLPGDQLVATAGVDQTIQCWDSATGRPVRTLDNHVGVVNDLAPRPGQSTTAPSVLASVSDDRTVRFWQPTIGRLIRFARLPSPPRAAVWSRTGDRLLVGCDDGRLRVLDPDTAGVVADLQGLDKRVFVLAIDPRVDRVLLAGAAGPVALAW